MYGQNNQKGAANIFFVLAVEIEIHDSSAKQFPCVV
jgi:hypothetical protein